MEDIWKSVKDYEGKYEVSNYGAVRSVTRVIIRANGWKHSIVQKVLSPAINHSRYLTVSLSDIGQLSSYLVHRLVAEVFCYKKESAECLQVNHIDGNKINNHYTNLEWVTHRENIQHCVDNGLQIPFKGEEIGNSILKDDDVRYIRKYYIVGERGYRKSMMNKFNVSECTIKDVLYGRTWKHITV